MEHDRFQFVTSFLKEALKDPKNPVRQVASQQARAVSELDKHHSLGINELGAYVAFSGSTFRKIGHAQDVSGEAIRQSAVGTIPDIWQASSPETKRKFPLRTLLHGGRLNKLDGKGQQTLDMVKSGKRVRQIVERLDLPSSELVYIRAKLRKRGVEVGYLIGENSKLAQSIRLARGDLETQRLLDKISVSFLNYCFNRGDNPLLAVGKLAKNGGYHVSNIYVAEFAQALERANVPSGRVDYLIKSGKRKGFYMTYYFIARQHEKRAILALKNNPELTRFRRNPVGKVCGPKPERFPGVWDLVKQKRVVSVGLVFKEVGVHFARNTRFRNSDFFTPDCPVTIFGYRGGFFCNERDVSRLKKHFKRRLQELK